MFRGSIRSFFSIIRCIINDFRIKIFMTWTRMEQIKVISRHRRLLFSQFSSHVVSSVFLPAWTFSILDCISLFFDYTSPAIPLPRITWFVSILHFHRHRFIWYPYVWSLCYVRTWLLGCLFPPRILHSHFYFIFSLRYSIPRSIPLLYVVCSLVGLRSTCSVLTLIQPYSIFLSDSTHSGCPALAADAVLGPTYVHKHQTLSSIKTIIGMTVQVTYLKGSFNACVDHENDTAHKPSDPTIRITWY